MAFFDWKDDYSVGIKKLDDQHRNLVRLLNELYDAMHSGKGKEVLGKVLNELVAYTKTHFASEEALMKMYDYPGYADHRQKHEKMTQHVYSLVEKFEAGEITSPIQISNFLKDWLSKHILQTDKAYGPYLTGKGAV
jgi:hemerythrin-like metal-binding protein